MDLKPDDGLVLRRNGGHQPSIEGKGKRQKAKAASALASAAATAVVPRPHTPPNRCPRVSKGMPQRQQRQRLRPRSGTGLQLPVASTPPAGRLSQYRERRPKWPRSESAKRDSKPQPIRCFLQRAKRQRAALRKVLHRLTIRQLVDFNDRTQRPNHPFADFQYLRVRMFQLWRRKKMLEAVEASLVGETQHPNVPLGRSRL